MWRSPLCFMQSSCPKFPAFQCRIAPGSAERNWAAGQVSAPVSHRTVEEIWYVVAGEGEIWRKLGEEESVIAARPGLALTIPLGAHFQFRAGSQALCFVAVTMPPWPGSEEAFSVPGRWETEPWTDAGGHSE